MKKSIAVPSLVLATVVASFLVAGDDEANFDGWEVLTVEASNVIRHGVHVKSALAAERSYVRLRGPIRFSLPVRVGHGDISEPDVFVTWYEILNTKSEPKRSLQIRDPLRGSTEVTLGQAKFVLSPAQRITTGPPSEVPTWLSVYQAYEIDSQERVDQVLSLSNALASGKRTIAKPVLFCVPAEEWHHEDHFPIADEARAFVVYEIDGREQGNKISTIDQFGLNKLAVQSSDWLCVPAEVTR